MPGAAGDVKRGRQMRPALINISRIGRLLCSAGIALDEISSTFSSDLHLVQSGRSCIIEGPCGSRMRGFLRVGVDSFVLILPSSVRTYSASQLAAGRIQRSRLNQRRGFDDVASAENGEDR